ncbi:coiled-coil domain-containing protein 97-like [Bufo gargarizans]|uniref:coiled-coil domain-containing protein 97-like n=1 Tax=Bufo gargarizans TaxID=30331 RepID=UPI001CF23821|nr:coiled-coil domain-containing protein 97-like [Bufo gargarizans]
MAAASPVCQELAGKSEPEDGEKKQVDDDGSEPSGEVQDTPTEDKNPIHDDEMDFIVDDGKVLAKALKVARSLGSREDPVSRDPALVSGPLLDMFAEIVESQVPIRSQQIGEPEFSHEQKMAMLLDLYKTKPLIFLERFRKVLKEEHLESFSHLSGDYAADFYFKEIRKASLRKGHHTRVRNKRYAALQQLISGGEYFSDEQMRVRDPLMYEHYVGQYQSEEEIMSQNSRDMAQASCLSDVLLNSCQEESLQRRLEAQREMEHNCEEEEEEEEEGDDNEEEDSELQSDEEQELANEERALMREEFVSRMHQRFLDGKDRDFDYSEVDDNPEFDNLDIVNRDEEERYFDDDDDEGIDEMEAEEDERENGQERDSSE